MSTTIPGGAYSTSTGITTPSTVKTVAQGAGNDQVFSSTLGSSANPQNTTTTTQKDGTVVYTGPNGESVKVVAQDLPNANKTIPVKLTGSDGAVLDSANPVRLSAGAGDNNVNVTGTGSVNASMGPGNDNVKLTTDGAIKASIALGTGDNFVSLSSQTSGGITIRDFNKGDQMLIADRTGDGVVTPGLDFTVVKQPGGTGILLPSPNGLPATKVNLVGVKSTKVTVQDDGVLTIQ